MLILPWLFLREPCDNPWSRIRKVLFAVLLCAAQLVIVLGFVKSAAVNVNMDARLRLQGYVYDAREALGQEKLSADEVCVRLTEKFYREADPAQWNALKKNVVVRSLLVIAGLLLLAGVLFASSKRCRSCCCFTAARGAASSRAVISITASRSSCGTDLIARRSASSIWP